MLLESKLIKYMKQANKYKININDKPKIINNFINQPWFFDNPNLNNLLNTMYICEYKSNLSEQENSLFVKIQFQSFFFIIKFKHVGYKLSQFISFYHVDDISNIYSFNFKSTNKLDYNELSKIIVHNGAKFTNLEIYRFISEIIYYYNGTMPEFNK
jgi:glucan biosynthesis protein